MTTAYKILGTNHTSFTVSSLDETVDFFTIVLGFEFLHRGMRDPDFTERVVGVKGARIEVAYLQGPGHRLELIQYHAPEDRSQVDCRPCDTGFAHLALDVDDIDAVLAAAEPYGVEPLNPPQLLNAGPNKGGKVVYTRNRDGVTVEFIQPPKI